MMHDRSAIGRSWREGERRLLLFAGETPAEPTDEVKQLRADLEFEKRKTRGYERQLENMRARMDALESVVQKVPAMPDYLPRNTASPRSFQPAVDHVRSRLEASKRPPAPSQQRSIFRNPFPQIRWKWNQAKAMMQIRGDVRRDSAARRAWLRSQRTKSQFTPNLPMGGVSGEEYMKQTFQALDRRYDAERPGFRSPSEAHFATAALAAVRRGDYVHVESNSSMYIDRTGKDAAYYAQFGGDPRRASQSPSQSDVPNAPSKGDVRWADRGGTSYASYQYPSGFAPVVNGRDMDAYMRTQNTLRESYANDMEQDYMNDFENGKLDEELSGDPGWPSLKRAMSRARMMQGEDPSRRYGDLAIFRSQVEAMRRRAGQRTQSRTFLDQLKAASPSPSDAASSIPGGYKVLDVRSRHPFFSPHERLRITIPADVLQTAKDVTVVYEPSVWNGNLSDEQFALLTRAGIAIERVEHPTATYAQGLSRLPKVEALKVYFTKKGLYQIDGQPRQIGGAAPETPPAPTPPPSAPSRPRAPTPPESTPSAPAPMGSDTELARWMASQEKVRGERPLSSISLFDFNELKQNDVISHDAVYREGVPVTVTINAQEWKLGSVDFKEGGTMNILKNVQDPLITTILSKGPLTLNTLQRAADRVLADRASEQRDDASIASFDVVQPGVRLGYVELYDGTDELARRLHSGNVGQKWILSRRYAMAPDTTTSINYAASEGGALTRTLQQMYEKGVRDFYIDLVAHGSETGAGFGTRRITPDSMAALLRQFPDCRVTLNLVSCHGAGMATMMQNFKDVASSSRGRITVFMQTKLATPNFAIDTDATNTSTAYNAALARALMQGYPDGPVGERLTYGQAHLKADLEAKRAEHVDAEAYRSAPGGSQRTAGTERAEGANGLS